jgi:hypothetical protein
MKTFTFKKVYESGNYISHDDGWQWICRNFVNDFCDIQNPDEIKISVSTKRIHSKGWKKIVSRGGNNFLIISGKITKHVPSNSANIYFEKMNTNVLWFKIESLFVDDK